MTDPRIQARRVSVARQRGRRRRHRIVAALIVAALCAGGVALVHSSVLGARHVRVSGAPNVPTSRLLAVAGLRGAPPLVDLNPGVIASRVERLPWVLTAEVRIAWPSTVAIRVTERIPVAAIEVPRSGGSYAVCDVSGRVLEVVASRPASLPVIVLSGAGAGEPGAPGTSLPVEDRLELQVAAAMPESMVPATTAITASSLGAIVGLTGKLYAIVGDAASLGQKFVSLATVLAHGDLQGITSIDLRVPAAPVLLPKGSSPIVPGNVGG
ncbi:MAG: FtsQ-type POTRA domain-containing protein [Acidimicrobiales bacterium]|jgi:cell division protein FtsQ